MKNRFNVICIIVLLTFVLSGCVRSNAEDDVTGKAGASDGCEVNNEIENEKDSSEKKEISEKEDREKEKDDSINFTYWQAADYIACAPEDVFEISTVAVKGKFGEKIGTYVGENTSPITQIKFMVDETFKGETKSSEITVEYYGGTLPLASYLEALPEDQIEKRGWNLPAAEVARATVTYEETETSVSVNENDTYLLFLSYNKDSDTYFILCDAYGACKMEGDKIYNLEEKSYVDIDFLSK